MAGAMCGWDCLFGTWDGVRLCGAASTKEADPGMAANWVAHRGCVV
jgi:hypothetical protein